MKSADKGHDREYGRVILDKDNLREIYQIFYDAEPSFEYQFDNYIVDRGDFEILEQNARSPKRIYVHNSKVSLYIYGFWASLHLWGEPSLSDSKLFIDLDNFCRDHRTLWRPWVLFIIPTTFGLMPAIGWSFLTNSSVVYVIDGICILMAGIFWVKYYIAMARSR